MRHPIAQHDPPRLGRALAARRIGHVDDLVPAIRRCRQALSRDGGGVVAENSSVAARGILSATQPQKEGSAQRNPRRVEEPGASPHASYHSHPMNRAEIERELIEVVRKEKTIPPEKLTLDTALADAGFDSLDALSVLFAIEEKFHISIPDDRARAIRTFGDMVDIIEQLLPA